MTRRPAVLAAFCLSMATGAAHAQGPAGCDPGEIVITFSHVVSPTGSPKGLAATELATRVNAEMNGEACMRVFPNGQLYDDDRVLEAVLVGDVQIAAPSLSKLEPFTLAFQLYDLFFLFDSMEAVDRFQRSPYGEEMLTSLEPYGLTGLGYWHAGMKQVSADRPVLVPSDLDGVVIRLQESELLAAEFAAIGALPHKLPLGEVRAALALGATQGQENAWSNIETMGLHEVQDGITETNHGVLGYIVLTSTSFWTGLPAPVREQFTQIFREVTDKYNALSSEIEASARQRIIDSGVTIRTPTEEQRQLWIDATRPVWERFADRIGWERINAAIAINAEVQAEREFAQLSAP
jgi:C4-dicarboxylate-binding protein DctP